MLLLSLSAVALIAVQDPPPAPPAPPAPPRVMMFSHGGPGLDKDGDGFVSREEFAAPMTDHFGRMDKNGDGRLSPEELSSGGAGEHDVMIRRGGPMSWTASEEGGRQIVVMGGPGGGETRTWASEDGREVRVETVVMRDAPGAAHVMPLPPHPPHAPGAPHPEGANVFVHRMGGLEGTFVHGPGDLDKDGDGRVTEDEFLAPMREGFRKMDADGDGVLEESERGQSDVRVFTRRVEAPRAD